MYIGGEVHAFLTMHADLREQSDDTNVTDLIAIMVIVMTQTYEWLPSDVAEIV